MVHNPTTIKADVVNFLTSIVEKTISMLENENLNEIEFFTIEDAMSQNYKFFNNFAYWTYSSCDDTIYVYVQKIAKINGKWVVYAFDEMIGIEEKPISIIEQVLRPYDIEFAVGLYNVVYNKINETKYPISIHN
jgi:hypothetical protein